MQAENLQIVVKHILGRLKVLLGVRTDTELAKELGVHQSTISAWKARGTLDFALLITKCNGVDWNWLLTGHAFEIDEEEWDESRDEGRETLYKELLAEKDEEIKKLNREIGAMEEKLSAHTKHTSIGFGSLGVGSVPTADYPSQTSTHRHRK
jgi:transcriptional regulator with XRE-family HTH domain